MGTILATGRDVGLEAVALLVDVTFVVVTDREVFGRERGTRVLAEPVEIFTDGAVVPLEQRMSLSSALPGPDVMRMHPGNLSRRPVTFSSTIGLLAGHFLAKSSIWLFAKGAQFLTAPDGLPVAHSLMAAA